MDKALAIILLLLVGGCTFIIQTRSPGAEIVVDHDNDFDHTREYERIDEQSIEEQIIEVPENK